MQNDIVLKELIAFFKKDNGIKMSSVNQCL